MVLIALLTKACPSPRLSFVILAILTIGVPRPAGAERVLFEPSATFYGVDNQARALVAGDLNGDGRSDAVVRNEGSRFVSLLLSTPTGTYLRQDFDTGAVPADIMLKDFDQDGHLDLAVVQSEYGTWPPPPPPGPRRVLIFAGHGGGTFGPPTVIPFTRGKPYAFAAGDMDEDGFLDFVISSDTGAWVLFGGPTGAGASGRLAWAIPAHGEYPLVVTDFTGDGHLDMVLGATFVAGHGDGTFESLGEVHVGDDTGDLDRLVPIITDACSHSLYATWSYNSCVSCGGSREQYRLDRVLGPDCHDADGCDTRVRSLDGLGPLSDQVGDFDGDGSDDFLTKNGFVLFGPEFESQEGITELLAGGQGRDFATGDVNGDAKLDLFLLIGSPTAPARRVEVLINKSARPTVPPPPGRLAAVPGGASIALSWDPVLHPDLAGYRIQYGVASGNSLPSIEATEGASPVEVPAGQTSLTLHCLPDSTFWVKVASVDDLGRESKCAPPAWARPRPVGGDFSFMGGSLNAASNGRWVMGLVQLNDGLSAARIVPGTVMVNGVGPADQLGVAHRDHDGRSELMIRFPRSAVQGSGSNVRVEGRVAGCRDTLRFAVDDSIRVRRPGLQPQADAEESLQSGDRSVVAFALHPVAPSPASAGCTIAFDLPEPAAVRLSVFDLRGRLMSSVLDRDMPAGSHSVWWDRQSLADGVYFARIEAGRYRAVRTIVLIR